MRHLLLGLCLVAAALPQARLAHAASGEARLIVIGDSLSAGHRSWPTFLREIQPRWNIQVLAQNGRTIRDYDPPRDLWTPGDHSEVVVYFLGANDALQHTPVVGATYRLKNHLRFLLDRNFRVLLINLPQFDIDNELCLRSLELHRELIASFRDFDPQLRVYDMNATWNPAHSPDRIHPDTGLSREMAVAIGRELDAMFPPEPAPGDM